MFRKFERGFSFIELLMVATALSFVTTGATTFVSHWRRGSPRPVAARDLAGQGRASLDQMVRELQLAGTPSQSVAAESESLTPVNSNPVAATLLVAEADQVVFDADLNGDGVVEQIEYRLHESALWRRAVSKNPDGSVPSDPPVPYEVLTEYVDNGNVPLFRYTADSSSETRASESPAAGNVNTVWVSLLLRPPVLNPKRPQFRTLRFDGIARLQNPESGNPVAGLREP
ncbi:MAG: hypothetical protein A3H28_14490 [Acidobacteria bacterium RIFCSPLOWO2_02_FULL_61_28]|nr:MAG: hypothetical protein A3H28_14490 [Acidobacteria bacterium RIFCSPLOWO2_02_FULL_61_28]